VVAAIVVESVVVVVVAFAAATVAAAGFVVAAAIVVAIVIVGLGKQVPRRGPRRVEIEFSLPVLFLILFCDLFPRQSLRITARGRRLLLL